MALAGREPGPLRRTAAIEPMTARFRILVFSSLFPSERAPNAGVFIRERMFRLAPGADLVVLAPVAWSPFDAFIRWFRPGFRPRPVRSETMQGIAVHRPRYLSLPGIGKRFDGRLMALACRRIVARLHAQARIDLIDAHFLYPDGYAAMRVAAALGIPATVSIRGSKDQRLVGTPLAPFLAATLSAAGGIIAVSDRLKRDVALPLGIPDDKVVVIGNGVDLDRFDAQPKPLARQRLGIAADASVVLGVGNLIPLKGFQRVIPLLPALRERFPKLVYAIVGGSGQQTSLQPELERLASLHGVTDIVRFYGPQPQHELKWFYAAADVFALATEYEGWANVFLEAMACGTPVVTTRVGGNPQVVADDELGILVDFWDETAFARALEQALSRTWDRDRLRRYAESHAWDLRVQELERYLRRVAGA